MDKTDCPLSPEDFPTPSHCKTFAIYAIHTGSGSARMGRELILNLYQLTSN